MPTDYLFIDYENVSPELITELSGNQIVLIFTGTNQSKINRDLVVSTQPFGKQIQWIVIEGNGKNAADFHISFYLGLYSEKEKTASFSILSKDTGFDPLVKHLILKGIKCKRIDDINKFIKSKTIPNKNKSVDEIVIDLENHFQKCNKNVRPKTSGKLITFVKSRGNLDEINVKPVIDKLIVNKFIEIKDEKVIYLVDELPF